METQVNGPDKNYIAISEEDLGRVVKHLGRAAVRDNDRDLFLLYGSLYGRLEKMREQSAIIGMA
ncbi:hypothetical protein BXY66_1204 [Shimia isoporae]|uniref:Uncharacterized protein n=1 Tax=Shimia isoporae TaxID=647720 RepID=A0A4R1NMZ6_9RHOB|nr:hypothetical protein [Shimia isoporae]TCL09159.1 hypothetical protein BXY66_1204 [Shimia isoporae]